MKSSKGSHVEFQSIVNKNKEVFIIKIIGCFKHSDNGETDPIICFNKQIHLLNNQFNDLSVKKSQPTKRIMVIDFKKCNYINSNGLTCLVSAFNLLSKHQVKLQLINVIDPIMSLFEQTKITEEIDCYPADK